MNCSVQIETCPLCRGSDLVQQGISGVSRCCLCGLCFRERRPTREDILASYDDGDTFRLWQQELAERTLLWQKRLSLVRRFATGGRLLDVGTGDGFFLEFAAHHFDVRCTEVSRAGCSYCLERGFHPHQAGLEELEIESASMDVVTLWHVLEHLPHPGRALEIVHDLLKPGGHLVVAVPNESQPLWVAGLLGKAIDEVFPLDRGQEIHLTYFTPDVLRRALTTGGYDVSESGVDDVDVSRTWRSILWYRLNQLVARVFGRHLGKAMYAVARKRG